MAEQRLEEIHKLPDSEEGGQEHDKEVEVKEPAEVEDEKLAEVETVKVVEVEKPAEVETVKPAEEDKPAEEETVNAVEVEKSAEVETVKEVEGEKEVETVKMVAVEKEVESPTESAAEKQACEDPGAADAPGTLSFPFLDEESTRTTLRQSCTLYVLMGLPGSGKTHLASAILQRYGDQCAVVSADAPGDLDAAVASCCAAGTPAVVVDDTNHANERLAFLGELAEGHRYFTLFLEPRTAWCRDLDALPAKSSRTLDRPLLQALKSSLEAHCCPLYFGWFLRHTFRDELEGLSKDLLKALQSLEVFKKHRSEFAGQAEEELNLEQYFQHTGPLHCTTKFCDYGRAPGAKEYMESQVVLERYGSVTQLELPFLFVTPRTLGARVALSSEQLQLWPHNDVDASDSALPCGSRAHVTLGCADGVEAVQTGVDLLQILQLQEQGQGPREMWDLELGALSYYGDGIWVLSLCEARKGPALFSSFHGRKKPDDLKKKKLKCILL